MPLQEVTNTSTASTAPVKSIAATTEANVDVVSAALAAWGKWSEDGGAACITLHAEDHEAIMPTIKTRPEYKTYKGRDGIVEWVEFLTANMEFQEFEVISLAADPTDDSIVHGKFSSKPKVIATGKQLPDAMIFDATYHVHNGKISKQEHDFGDISLMEELWNASQAEANIATVGAALAAWGKWAEDDGAACLALFTEGVESVIPPVRTRPEYKNYTGRDGLREWVEFIGSSLDFKEFQVLELSADPAGVVHMRSSASHVNKTTGKLLGPATWDAWYTIEAGKICKQVLGFPDISVVERLWGVAEAEAGIATVGAALAAWGKWAEDGGAACLALYDEDCEVVVAPVKGKSGKDVPGYGRHYKGREGVHEYVEFIGSELDFEGYQVTGITADTGGLIHIGYTYQPTVKATGKQCTEVISGEAVYRLSEENGKLSELRLPAWGAKFEEMYQ